MTDALSLYVFLHITDLPPVYDSILLTGLTIQFLTDWLTD